LGSRHPNPGEALTAHQLVDAMSAEYAMRQIGQLLDEFTDSGARELLTLMRIAQVVGQYEGSKK
jgi:DnaJ-domain-containing protein 1